jgi:general secretion pathway protein G
LSGRAEGGFSYLELIATAGILAILASAILPLARVTRVRQKELELRSALRLMREKIDEWKRMVDAGQIGGTDVKLGSEGYPEDLDILVEGVNLVGRVDHKQRFLRRIPLDPMTGKPEWGLRCYQDKPDGASWCGQNVFDVYSLSAGRALDGSYYKDW